jgi:Secretion system C-terminal sorting domain
VFGEKDVHFFKESNVVTKTVRALAEITGPFETCVGNEVTFTAATSDISSIYSWYFEGANVSSIYTQVAKVKFTASGSRRVRLEVATPGCLRTASHLIEVKSCLAGSGTMGLLQAHVMSTDMVKLNWTTKNELLPSMYIIEKSADGVNFIEVADIKSQNNETNNYSYNDHEPKRGRSFYRVKHIESDGKVSYSSIQQTIIFINGGDPVMAYPNPVNNKLFVEVLEGQSNEGTIEVYNTFGQLVNTQQYTKDQVRYEVDTDGLPMGTYIVKIRQNDGTVKSVKINKL